MNLRMKIDLTIVIPSYNEEKRILRTLKAYTTFFSKKLKCEFIISDQSNDNTRSIVREFMRKHKDVHLLCFPGRGKGGAVLRAFEVSNGELLGFTDADNATSPEEFYRLYKNIKDYDAIIGSRGLTRKNIIQYHQSPLRRLCSFFLGIIVRVLFGLKIKDTQCGAKIFKRKKLLRVLPKMRIANSIFDIELLWRFSKVGRIKEMPIKWVDDPFSHFRWYEVIGELYWLIRVRFGI